MRITLFTLLFSLAVPAMVTVPALLPEELPLHLRPRPENVGVTSPEVDLNGLWVGELLQNAGGIAERFDLSMQPQRHIS